MEPGFWRLAAARTIRTRPTSANPALIRNRLDEKLPISWFTSEGSPIRETVFLFQRSSNHSRRSSSGNAANPNRYSICSIRNTIDQIYRLLHFARWSLFLPLEKALPLQDLLCNFQAGLPEILRAVG